MLTAQYAGTLAFLQRLGSLIYTRGFIGPHPNDLGLNTRSDIEFAKTAKSPHLQVCSNFPSPTIGSFMPCSGYRADGFGF